MMSEYTLYGAPLSLYTGKARAYLIYKELPYKEVFSSLNVYKKIIIPKTGVRFIPVLETPDKQFIQDTSEIIDTLETHHRERPVVPTTPKQKLVSYLLEAWCDEWLVIPAMHYRWNKDNFPFIYQEFGKVVAPKMPRFIRAFIGKKIGAKFKGFVPILGITEKSIPAIESWYQAHVLPLLDQHFSQHNYLLGGAPSLGDFCLMGPLYAHLYRDPAPGKIMRRDAPNVAKWVERMNQPIAHPKKWLDDDQIADNLLPILTRLFKEFWPVLENTASAFEIWAQNHPDQQHIPRTIGEHKFTVGNVQETRAIMTFHQWKLQRVLDCYQGFNDQDKHTVDGLLSEVGAANALNIELVHRVKRKNNTLVLA